MAKATTELRSQRIVTLEMTEDEAAVLLQLFQRVGGQPDGPRGKIDAVKFALEDAGVERDTSAAFNDARQYACIYFS